MDRGNFASLGTADRNALRRERTRRPALEGTRPVGDRKEKTWKAVSRTEAPSEFEDQVGRSHLRVSAADTGLGRAVAGRAEVLVLDAYAVLAGEKILRTEAGQEARPAYLAAVTAHAVGKTAIVKGQSRLGKESSESAVEGEVPRQWNRWYRREPHARHFIEAILRDRPVVVLVVEFTECHVAHLGRPVPVDLVAYEPLETGIKFLLGFSARSPRAAGGGSSETEIRGIELNARVACAQSGVPIGVLGVGRGGARQQQCRDCATQSRVFHPAGPFLPLECPKTSLKIES